MAGQRYSEDFKAQALALVAQKVKPATQVARAFGAPPKALYKWMEAALWFVKRFPPLSSRKIPHGWGGILRRHRSRPGHRSFMSAWVMR